MNVIVIECDSWHPGFLGPFGNDWIQTPNLDAFSQRALTFDNAYPENIPTLPTRMSWWTGRFHFANRVWQPLPLTDTVLPEAMWPCNIRSALITDVYHMHRPGFGYGRGFDEVVRIRGQEYDEYVPAEQVKVELAESPHHWIPDGHPQAAMWAKRFEQYLRNHSRITDEDETYIAQMVTRGCRWLTDNATREQPLFLWLDCFDPHEPWDPPEPYRSMYAGENTARVLFDPIPGRVGEVISEPEVERLRATYAGEITLVDHWLGKLFGCLEEHGYFEDSLILWLTDHGEPLGEHGVVRKCRPWLHEELVHTAWMMHLPGDERAGERTSAFVQAPDLMPTLLDFLGVPIPETVTGSSLLPLIRGEVDLIRECACLGMSKAEWLIRTDEYAYLLPQKPQLPGDPPRGPMLFDRRTDSGEHQNLLFDHPELAAELELRLRRFVDEIRA